jgi:DNA-binding transcriptional ArsR family regulator
MQVFRWPVEKERQIYEKILNDNKSRNVLDSVLDEISKRAAKKENLMFKSSEMAETIGEDVQKVNETLKYIFNLNGFRANEPYLTRSGDSFQIRPELFPEKRVKRLKAKYETIAMQRQIENFFETNFPEKRIQLNEEQVEELERTMDSLKSLHQKERTLHHWQEFLATYELLRYRNGTDPDGMEVGRYVGLKDGKLNGRNWIEETKSKGYDVSLSPHIEAQTIRKNKKKVNVEESYRKLKLKRGHVTAKELSETTSIQDQVVRVYAEELGLKLDRGSKVRRNERIEEIKTAYEMFKTEYPPSKIEIEDETGIPKDYVRKVCRSLGLPLLNDSQINKKRVLKVFRDLQEQGVDTDAMSDGKFCKHVNEEYKMCFNVVRDWRRELEKEKKIDIPKTREMSKVKYKKYESAYRNIVKRKIENNEKIRFVSIAKELSELFGENVPTYRVIAIRDATGIPKVINNEARYESIVKVFKENPGLSMEEWADKAQVSTGFLYSTLRNLKKDSEMLERLNAPKNIIERFSVRESPVLKEFKALGNANRMRILKALGQKDEMTVEEILDEMGYKRSKWQNTIEYHCGVLERAGMIVEDKGSFAVTEKTETIMPLIQEWDLEKVVPEEIFGTGYNKPLFTSALSGDKKSLKEIIRIMREYKGAVPVVVPSSKAPERHPMHDASKTRRLRFKKYFNPQFGMYEIKDEYSDFLVQVTSKVKEVSSPNVMPKESKKRETLPPQYILKEVNEQGLSYMKIRDMMDELLRKKVLYQFQQGLSDKESLSYMQFIEKNFQSLCRRMNVKTDIKSLKIYSDSDDMHILEAK